MRAIQTARHCCPASALVYLQSSRQSQTHCLPIIRYGFRQRKSLCRAALEGLGTGELVAGVDLGTTNSCIAITRGEGVQVIPVEGNKTTPSIVAFLKEGKELVGKHARLHAKNLPHYSYFSVKRFIGRNFEDVQKEAGRVPYRVDLGEDGEVIFPCSNVAEGRLRPQDVSAKLLAYLLANATALAGAKISKAVISVPSYFNDTQREATIAAGKIAGLKEIKLIKEPVAAALAYGLDIQQDQTVMVLDLGGGTFDVSILEVGGGVVEVLSTGGDPQLGGDDWDNLIVDWIVSNHLSATGISRRDPIVSSNLKTVAQIAKVKLSSSKEVELKLPFPSGDQSYTTVRLTQAELDRLSGPLYKRLQLPVNACCWQAGVDLEAVITESKTKTRPKNKRLKEESLIRPKNRPPISKILLVGGGTRMPGFQRFVHNMTGMKPGALLVDPDLAVAIGSAIHAGSLSEGGGRLTNIQTMDPLRKALMEAIAKKQLLEHPALAREALGDDYEDFVEEQLKEDAEWQDLETDLSAAYGTQPPKND